MVIGGPGHEDGVKRGDEGDDDVDPLDPDRVGADLGFARVDEAQDEFVCLVIKGKGQGKQSHRHQRADIGLKVIGVHFT